MNYVLSLPLAFPLFYSCEKEKETGASSSLSSELIVEIQNVPVWHSPSQPKLEMKNTGFVVENITIGSEYTGCVNPQDQVYEADYKVDPHFTNFTPSDDNLLQKIYNKYSAIDLSEQANQEFSYENRDAFLNTCTKDLVRYFPGFYSPSTDLNVGTSLYLICKGGTVIGVAKEVKGAKDEEVEKTLQGKYGAPLIQGKLKSIVSQNFDSGVLCKTESLVEDGVDFKNNKYMVFKGSDLVDVILRVEKLGEKTEEKCGDPKESVHMNNVYVYYIHKAVMQTPGEDISRFNACKSKLQQEMKNSKEQTKYEVLNNL